MTSLIRVSDVDTLLFYTIHAYLIKLIFPTMLQLSLLLQR